MSYKITESINHPLVQYYKRRFKLTNIQRDDFLSKNLYGNSYQFTGVISHIDSSRLVIHIRFESPDSEGHGGYLLACFRYDSAFSSTLLKFNLQQLVKCTGKLIGVDDCDFTLQLTEIVDEKPLPATNSSNSSCFIATACYGSNQAEEVLFLREYRDKVLLNSILGKFSVFLYYRISPPIAKLLENSEPLKTFVRKNILVPIISKIRQNQ